MASSSSTTTLAVRSGDLADLVFTSTSATVHPNDDSILSVLQARFRSDQPYTRISTSNYVVVNPYKALANTNNVSAQDYEERCYKDTNLQLPGTPSVQPHLYELAARMYLLMRRRNESQAVIFRFATHVFSMCTRY
jgi:chitin synthase